MVLNVHFRRNADSRGFWYHDDAWGDVSILISEVLESLRHEDPASEWVAPGEDAWFCFTDKPYKGLEDGQTAPDAYLRIAVNRSTGFGALFWFAVQDRLGRSDVLDHIWISDNPTPPDFDPRVVADPGHPTFHHPRSTLPISQVHAAIEEFCQLGTGHRPECIRWVQGDLKGQRVDQEQADDSVEIPYPLNPWG